MSKPFKLSSALYGHSLDVRCVAVNASNAIVSGSRDKTAKLWLPNGFNAGFSETMTYREHKNFVASVLLLEKTKEYPSGLIVTGGNDNVILVYEPHRPVAILTLKEHTNVVCSLAKGLEPNEFLSSSWDATAKMWNLVKPQAALITFSGHTAAIWSVIQLKNTTVVTASADKTIGIFSKDGFKINTIQGHTDCVRDLADFPELNCFVSVSNDASIKVWTYNGVNANTYYGHTNYIYSIARNTAGGDNCFVTSDEDRTVRYWKDGVNTETFQLPAQSVWTVACLSNGDVVTGASDGVVRIFTQDESRYSSDETLKTFEEEVNVLSKQSAQEIGGYKVSDLPGREALYEPGKRTGQMKMIREPQGVVAYTWVDEGENSHWEKIGDVLGGADPNAGSKTTYEGKPYDFVFSVDVEDGMPPLKLPYNKGDDPYVAAHNFLEKNMLPAAYLDQVVDFILKNSKDPNESLPLNSEFVDPFTGSSRYAPTGGTSSASGSSGVNLDPFTGVGSYSSSQDKTSTSTSTIQTTPVAEAKFFPQYEYRGFEMGNPSVILEKLKEFNQKAGAAAVGEPALEHVILLCSGPSSNPNVFDTLFDLLKWSDDIVFPVLDVVRMAVRNENNNKIIAQKDQGAIIEKLIYYISQDCAVTNSTLVALRVFCNLFMYPSGEQLIFTHRVNLLENVTSLSPGNKNIQIALATFLLNITILSQKFQDEFGVILLASVVPDIVLHLDDSEAQFRGLVAIGTLLSSGKGDYRKLIQEKIQENENFIHKLSLLAKEHTKDVELKRKNCATQVLLEITN